MSLQSRTVLMVDDNVQLCELTTAVLEEAGYRVVVTCDAAVLEQVLSTRRIGLATVHVIPDDDGPIRACRTIRETAGATVPLLLSACHVDVTFRPEAKALGA